MLCRMLVDVVYTPLGQQISLFPGFWQSKASMMISILLRFLRVIRFFSNLIIITFTLITDMSFVHYECPQSLDD